MLNVQYGAGIRRGPGAILIRTRGVKHLDFNQPQTGDFQLIAQVIHVCTGLHSDISAHCPHGERNIGAVRLNMDLASHPQLPQALVLRVDIDGVNVPRRIIALGVALEFKINGLRVREGQHQ
jgi:hypothetical protein